MLYKIFLLGSPGELGKITVKTPISKSNAYYTLVTSKIINDPFNKFSDITNRKDLYSVKPDAKNKGKGVTPLVMDTNPALPHVSSINHRHKHLLEKDKSLKTIILPGSVKIKQLVAC